MKNEKEKEKPKGLIQSIWNRINSIKKRNIGIFALGALRLMTAFKPELLSVDQIEATRFAIDIVLFGGTAHSLSRTGKAKQIGNKIASLSKSK